jgi:uroporphyrinogen decarboxylase
MNSLERVLKTISHRQPDRVPIGEWGIDHDHVSRIIGRHTYWRNRKDCTLALWEGRRDEMVESKKNDYAELIEKLDYDVIPVHLVAPKGYECPDPPKKTGDGVWEDSKGSVYKYSASNDSIMPVTPAPAKDDISEEKIAEMIENIPDFDDSEFELVDFICEKFGRTRAVLFREFDLHHTAICLFGGDETHRLMIPLLNPDAVKRAGRYAIAYARKLIDKCFDRNIAIIMNGTDFGNNMGCTESPETIRNLHLPIDKEFVRHIESNGRVPFLHSCGNIWEIMDDIADTGYKGYQSIQASAGMDWAKLKKMYGNRMTLWAGVQCETLILGSKEDVKREVINALETLMPCGGFIFGSTNSVQYGADTDNYLYALDLVRKYGNYD